VSTSGNRVKISLAQKDVVDSLQLNGAAVLRLEQHRISNLHAAHVRADGDHLGPTQAASYLGGCGDDDATTGASLTVFAALADEHSIVEELDRYRSIKAGARIGDRRRNGVGFTRRGQRNFRPISLIAT